ncbi:hypothetical protein [Paenarthrobacter ureafaciens]|uniref:hypothetical protein n=1 Tax=Paenarthrobacter ureafaciens TaxID=37931 RepID=UPI0009AEE389|nr:hypothetical protein [Paenarthrobacter ureafaciens]GLU58563.1 hypothetical protein Pure01_10760 [Paenarthrobacter ureafaciens]GLU61808.1 hypothetical protein Pure02_00580 [Paenarthrobacter ureafaciens]GLU66082.1 hypothetical protein Pure03_00580 [Paenarthrobacter ureafaciens]GLU71594.1 hypothetical protein Pure04_13090 [Paenarthrobacter ureafaciens]GLU74619.1 hypothetical protein Pure05_00590 [Paenarthrobacter ureafaciens]
MNDWLQWILGAGTLGAAVTLVGTLINRRNVKSEAKARDLKSPAEVDNLVATTHRANLDSVLTVNAELRSDNKELRERLDKVEARQQEQGRAQAELGALVDMLQRGLASAYAYITTLLKIIEDHLPHIDIPTPPKGYKPTPEPSEQEAT